MSADALARLAASLSESTGTYAILLGSGISRPAGIPTGWEIATDRIPRMAIALGEDPPDDPAAWYEERSGRPVNYSQIIEWFGGTPAERARVLSSYIEPDDDDLRAGRKQPTLAHRAIAKLAKYGCIRVIVTTNIDRLMESALSDEGIYPTVINSADDIEGMVPLSQGQFECVVFKVHGDYKDIRSSNTEEELQMYPPAINQLLGQVFGEFGMVVCGWSARWDAALCNAIKNCESRLYSWFWAEHGETSEEAEELIQDREAGRITIEDADAFFAELLRRVERLKGIKPGDGGRIDRGVSILQNFVRRDLGIGGSEIDGRLSSVVAQLYSVYEAGSGEGQVGDDAAELSRQVDFARDLIRKGLVVEARRELERINGSASPIPDGVRVRIFTNLAACEMAEDDVEAAVRWAGEAYELEPENASVVANAALAAHRADDLGRALELAEKARELNPKDSPATSVVMVEMWRGGEEGRLDAFVEAEEWVNQDAQCSLVLASIRLLQSRFVEAEALCRGRVEADDQDPHAHLALSQCLMKSVRGRSVVVAFDDSDLETLEEAISEANLAIDLLEYTDLKFQHLAALILRGCARAMVGLSNEAMGDFDEVLRERPGSSEAKFYKGLLHLNDGRAAEAVTWFEQVEDRSQLPDMVVPFAQSLVSSGRPREAIDVLRGSFDLNSAGWEEMYRAELLFRAESLAGFESTVVPALEVVLQALPANPAALVLAAVVRDGSGDHDGAEEALLLALDSVDADEKSEILMRLGYHYESRGRFSDAADRFREVVGENASHPLAISMLVCLNNGKRLKEALSLSRDIQRSVANVPRVVIDIELSITELVGDGGSAILLRERLCAHAEATPADLVELAWAQLRDADFDGARNTVESIDPVNVRDFPLTLFELAKIKRVIGLDGYLDDAYVALRCGVDQAEVHLGYFWLFVGRENEIQVPDSVAPGCAVFLRGDARDQWWSIVDEGEAPLGGHDVALEGDLGSALAGKRVGDTVVLRQGYEDLQYEVAEIQSKYVRAFQEIAAEFSTRFPNNMGLSRVALDPEDPSKFLEMVDERDRFVRDIEQLYRDGAVPLVAVAERIGRFAFEFWNAGAEHGLTRILFGLGTDEETDRAGVVLSQAVSIVLDTVALFTVHELGIIELLRERFDRVVLPQLVFDGLQAWAVESRMRGGRSGFIGRAADGRYTISEPSEDVWNEWQKKVESVLDLAGSLDLVPSYGLLDVDDVEQAVAAFTPSGAGSIWAGEEGDGEAPVLVSDDLALSKVARAFGKDAINTQNILLECLRSSALTAEDYSRLVGRLASMNYWFVRVRSDDIVIGLSESSYASSDETRAMLRTLQGPECTEDTAIGVAVNVVVALVLVVPPGQFDLILGLVMSTLQMGRRAGPVWSKFEQAIRSNQTLAASDRQRILESMFAYRAGGMARSGSKLIVIRY